MPLIFLLLLCISTASFAEENKQDVPTRLLMGLQYSSINSAKLSDDSLSLKMQQTKFKLPIGRYQLFGNTLVPQFAYEETTFDVANRINNQITLYTVKTPFMFIEKKEAGWTRIINITPSWHTDLKAKDDKSYSLMGLLLWRYGQDQSPHGYTLGIGINRLFGEYKPVPIMSYRYQASAYTRYDLGFPISKIEHRLNQDWSFFSSLGPVGGNWRYNDEQNQQRLNLSYKSWMATLGIRRHLLNNFWVTLEWGQSFNRTLDFNNRNIDSQEVSIGEAGVYKLSIGLHP